MSSERFSKTLSLSSGGSSLESWDIVDEKRKYSNDMRKMLPTRRGI